MAIATAAEQSCEDLRLVGEPRATPAACRGGEQDLSTLHVERSSRRTSSALTRRPASRSPSDWRRASCKAARSASSSQSPGSRGKSSTSVPSGRSVGSSNTSRPARTRAFSVMGSSLLRKRALASTRFAANTLHWWAPQIGAGDEVRWPYGAVRVRDHGGGGPHRRAGPLVSRLGRRACRQLPEYGRAGRLSAISR